MASTKALGIMYCVALAFACPSAALAADAITLRLADSFPAGHYISEKVTRWFIDQVTERTGRKVTFQYYPAEQLGKSKDLLSLTQTGVADIGYIAPSFATDRLPLSGVAELPLSFVTSCEGTRAFYKLATDGIVAERELKPNNVRLLFTIVLPPYQIFFRGAGLHTLADIRSQKIRTSGKAKELALQALGGVPIQIASPDVYPALSRGTIDGMLFPYSSIFSYDLQDLVKSASVGANFGSFVVTYMISEARWRTLAPDVQKVMTDVGNEASERGCQLSQDNEATDRDRLKAKGVSEIEFSAADQALLVREMVGVSRAWAKELDQRGKPGSDVLQAFEKALH